MHTLREWLIRLAAALSPPRSNDDVEAELRSHAELAAERGERTTGTSQAI